MKRILFTLLMAVVLIGGIVVDGVLAADRDYKIKNCQRTKVWPEILDHIRLGNPELKDFIEKNIKPTREDPLLSKDDFQEIERLDKNIQWYAAECVLLMKEINILVKAVHEVDPEETFFIANPIYRILGKLKIPVIVNSKGVNDLAVFSFNFSPFSPEETY